MLLERGCGDDEALHLGGALVYLGYSRVAVVALGRHVANVTHAAEHLSTKYVSNLSTKYAMLSDIDAATISSCNDAINELKANKLTTVPNRNIFKPLQLKVLAKLESECFEDFLGSSHFQYILELKAKEGHIPTLDDFKVIRVMGEGGFGQVIDVVKRDCGVHYR